MSYGLNSPTYFGAHIKKLVQLDDVNHSRIRKMDNHLSKIIYLWLPICCIPEVIILSEEFIKQYVTEQTSYEKYKSGDVIISIKDNILISMRREPYGKVIRIGPELHWYNDFKKKSYVNGKKHGIEDMLSPDGSKKYSIKWHHGEKKEILFNN